MNSQLLFLTMCIPLRIIFALLPNYDLVKRFNFNINPKLFYTIVGLVFLAISIGFLYLYFTAYGMKVYFINSVICCNFYFRINKKTPNCKTHQFS